MKSARNTDQQILDELKKMKKRIASLEKSKEDYKRAEKIQKVLFNISQATSATENLDELIKIIHKQLSSLIETTNFFIALYDKKSDRYTFPFYVDQYDKLEEFEPIPLGKSLTDYVRRTGKPLLAKDKDFDKLEKEGEIELVGTDCRVWLGVPLKISRDTIGVAVVQSYTDKSLYTKKDMELLSFVSDHIAMVIERKRAEDALRESEEQYRTVVEESLQGIVIIQNGKVVFANSAIAEIAGYSFEELQVFGPEQVKALIHPDDKEKVWKRLAGRIAGKKILPRYEIRIIRKDGSVGWLEVHSKRIEYGGLPAVQTAILDITDRRNAEKGLRESEEKYRSLADQSLVGIFILQDGRVVYANQGFADISEYSIDEMLNWGVEEFSKMVHPEDSEFVMEQGRKKQKGDKNAEAHYTYRMITKSSKLKYVELHSDTMTYGARLAVQGVIIDITNRKKAEEALQKSEYELSIHNRISNIFFTFSDDKMYGEVLQVVLEVMKSKHGVFGYINKNGDLVCPSMTRDIWDQCQIPDKDIIFPRDAWAGIWGRALKEKRTLLQNKSGKVPKGHIPIKRVLDVPIIHHRKVIGNLIAANKESDYDEGDKYLLESIANHIAPVLHARLQRDIKETERKQTEEALKESEELYRLLVKTAPDAFTATDLEGHIVEVSQQTIDQHGFKSAEDLIGKDGYEFIAPEDREKARDNFRKTLKEEVVRNIEYNLIRKDGTRFIGEVNAALIKDAHNKPKAFIFNTRDITERKRIEEALKESEKKYRNLVELANDGIVIIQDSIVKYVNPRLAEMWSGASGTIEEIIGTSFTDYIYPDEVQKVLKLYKERIAGKDVPQIYETILKRKDGSKLYVELNAGIITYQGKPADFVIVRDITERKKAEEALRESEEKFRTLAEQSPNMIFINKKGKIVYANKRCEDVMRYKREKFYSPDFDFLTLIAPESIEVIKFNFKNHMQGKDIPPYEYTLITKSGKKIEALITTKLIDYEDGRAILGIITDITERKRMEEQNINLNEELNKKNRQLEEANIRLKELSIKDGLTKIYNHRFFQEALMLSFDRAKRSDQSLSCIMFDIDDFKKINDEFGHRAGDFILTKLAELVNTKLRRSDIFARYGGEEFVILLHDNNLESSIKVAEKIRALVESYDFDWGKRLLKITISLGVSSSEVEGIKMKESLLEVADSNMLKAKKKGKNCVYAYQ